MSQPGHPSNSSIVKYRKRGASGGSQIEASDNEVEAIMTMKLASSLGISWKGVSVLAALYCC